MHIPDPVISGIESRWQKQQAVLATCQISLAAADTGGPTADYVHKLNELAEDLAKSNANAVFSHARQHFSTPGCRLDIEMDDFLCKKGFAENSRWVRYRDITSFAKVWEALESTYGGGIGERMAIIAVANQLVSSFCLRSKEPVRVRGGILLSHAVYKDSYSNEPGKITYGCQTSISAALNALVGFASHIANPSLTSNLRKLQDCFDLKRGLLTLREKLQAVGDDSDEFITITTYFSKIEYHLSPKLTDAFQVFIAEYATSLKLNEAA